MVDYIQVEGIEFEPDPRYPRTWEAMIDWVKTWELNDQYEFFSSVENAVGALKMVDVTPDSLPRILTRIAGVIGRNVDYSGPNMSGTAAFDMLIDLVYTQLGIDIHGNIKTPEKLEPVDSHDRNSTPLDTSVGKVMEQGRREVADRLRELEP